MAEKASPSCEEILTAFAAFDKDHSGTVTRDEFVAILTRRVPGKPPPIAAAEAERQFSLFDKNGDGVISFEEFAGAWSDGTRPSVAAADPVAALGFTQSTPMLVMSFTRFKGQGRIFKSVKKWRDEALRQGWLVEYDRTTGKVVVFISHTCAPSHSYFADTRQPSLPTEAARLPCRSSPAVPTETACCPYRRSPPSPTKQRVNPTEAARWQ